MSVYGFDIGYYPGKTAMQHFWTGTPFNYVGFYLPSPHFRGTPVFDKAAHDDLVSIGYGFMVYYVGRQAYDPATLKTFDQGIADGADAIAQAKACGFTQAVIFLDIEGDVNADPAIRDNYLVGFASAFGDSLFAPGVYCSAISADYLYAVQASIFHWNVARHDSSLNNTFSGLTPNGSIPTGSGKSFANVWQYTDPVSLTRNGSTLSVDLDVADSSDPSITR